MKEVTIPLSPNTAALFRLENDVIGHHIKAVQEYELRRYIDAFDAWMLQDCTFEHDHLPR